MTEAILLILFALTIAATLYMGHKLDMETGLSASAEVRPIGAELGDVRLHQEKTDV